MCIAHVLIWDLLRSTFPNRLLIPWHALRADGTTWHLHSRLRRPWLEPFSPWLAVETTAALYSGSPLARRRRRACDLAAAGAPVRTKGGRGERCGGGSCSGAHRFQQRCGVSSTAASALPYTCKHHRPGAKCGIELAIDERGSRTFAAQTAGGRPQKFDAQLSQSCKAYRYSSAVAYA